MGMVGRLAPLPAPAVRAALLGALVVLSALAVQACDAGPANDPTSVDRGADLPGVDTHELTPRERHDVDRYVGTIAAPCPEVAVSVGQCVRERRACRACLPAAAAIVKAVREGLAEEQIRNLYKQRFDASAVKQVPLDLSPVRGGKDDAPVTIVEFADFECPFCQHIAPQIDALVEKRQGAVRFVYKFMPLAMHPHGEVAARAAIAAQAQGKFWEMHHQLFTNAAHLEDSDLDSYAKAIGLDVGRFHADMAAPATKARLDADRKLADSLGVKGTPTLYINGREYDGKADLDDWVDTEIARASK
jgi:protein-disulfide isomerase